VLWWWVSWESAVARSGNLLLCLRVAVAGGARWAKMTEWVRSFLCLQVAASRPCSMESRATFHLYRHGCSRYFHLVQVKQRIAVMEALVCCQRERDPCLSLANKRSRVLLFSKTSRKQRRVPIKIATDGKEHRAAKGASRWQHNNNTNKSKN